MPHQRGKCSVGADHRGSAALCLPSRAIEEHRVARECDTEGAVDGSHRAGNQQDGLGERLLVDRNDPVHNGSAAAAVINGRLCVKARGGPTAI